MSFAAVGAVTAVVSAGVGAYSAYSSSKQASAQNKAAQGQAGAGNSDLYGQKFEPVPYNDRIGTDASYAKQVMPDVLDNVKMTMPEIFGIAHDVNQYNERVRKNRTGGKFQETIMQEGANLSAMEKGQVPQDVIDQINRMVAENLGGAFDPSAGMGGSATAADAARRLGLTSLDIMQTGMSMAPSWRSNVDSFIYKPQNVMADFISPVAAITSDANRLQMARDEAEYVSANNIARAEAMPNPGTVGSFRDSLTLGALQQQNSRNEGDALAGLVNAGGAAVTQFGNAFSSKTPTANPMAGTAYRPNPTPSSTVSWRPQGV